VVKGLSAEWGMCSRTALLNHRPWSLSFWNNAIVVGSTKGDIFILDAITGSQTAVLPGHTDAVASVTFSSDGALLVSGSHDKTIKLWDVQTGGIVRTFHGHTGEVLSVSISADHSIIASGSKDKTLRLWDIQKEECYQFIEQQEWVSHVRFSPTDPQCLMSVATETIQQWDIDGHKVGPTYSGQQVAFSQDGTQFISCRSEDVTVHNINSGLVVANFHMMTGHRNLCFSPDHKLMAAAAANDDIYVWDITGLDPHLIQAFNGHIYYILSLAFFSPSTLISAAQDNSIKFWQIGASSTGPPVTNPKSTSLTSAPTKSAALKPKNELIIPSDLPYGVRKTWGILTTPHKKPPQIPVEGSHQNNIQMIDNKLVFVWYADKKINIWDAEKGGLLQTINVPGGNVKALVVSGDGTKVFCGYEESIQAWDIWTGEAVGKVRAQDVNIQTKDGMVAGEKVHIRGIDGSKVWVCFSALQQEHTEGWDFGIPGSPPAQFFLPGKFPDRIQLNDNKVWEMDMCRMKDIVTGKVVFQLPGGSVRTRHVQWDSHYLVILPWLEEVVILNFSHMSIQ